MEIRYDQGSEFIGHKFSKLRIEMDYGITVKPSTLGNPTSNEILERIHQVLVNIVQTCNITQTYVDKDDPLSDIFSTAAFALRSTTNRLKGYILGN